MIVDSAVSIFKPNLSPGRRDPWLRLSAAILKQSVADFWSSDPIAALSALAFYLDDSNGAPLYLDCLGFELSGEAAFRRVVIARRRKSGKIGGNVARRT